MHSIIEEVRYELDIRGYENVSILVSGSLDVESVTELREIVDGFRVGTYISGARPVDFALDIVEREGVPCAKRGKLGGRKQVWRDWETLEHALTPAGQEVEGMTPILKRVIENGKAISTPDHNKARSHLLAQLSVVQERHPEWMD